MHGNELRLCMGQGILPTLNYLCRASDIAAAETILNVFIYDTVSGRNSNLPGGKRIR